MIVRIRQIFTDRYTIHKIPAGDVIHVDPNCRIEYFRQSYDKKLLEIVTFKSAYIDDDMLRNIT